MLAAAILPVVVVWALAVLLTAAAGRMGRTALRVERDRAIETHLEHITLHLALNEPQEVAQDFAALRRLVPRTTGGDRLSALEDALDDTTRPMQPAQLHKTLHEVHTVAHDFRAESVAYLKNARITDRIVIVLIWVGALLSIGASILTARWLTRHADRLQQQTLTAEKDREIKQDLLQRIAHAATEWQHLFDGMDGPILVIDESGTLIRMNEVARKLAGRDYHDLIGADVQRAGGGPLWSAAAKLAAQACSGRRAAEQRIADTDNGKTWEVRAIHYVQPDGEVRAIVKARDVTEIIELEESLRLADKLSTIGSVTAGVAHEVRNPLFSISSLVDALDSTFPDRDELRPFMERLRSQVDRLRNLMTDLLEYGRASTVQAERGDVGAVVESAIAMCRGAGSDVDIVLQNDCDNSEIKMDAPRLELVFRNLIENAQQHAPARSRIEVRVARVRTFDREWIECRVGDRGSGFDDNDLPHVFEPFYTRRKGGTGLGLSIVQRIVLEHQGMVRATNRREGGAEVIVRLPAQEQPHYASL